MFGAEFICARSGGVITIFKPDKNGFDTVNEYAYFGAALVEAGEHGVIFENSRGLKGFIAANGSLTADPGYGGIEIYKNYSVLEIGGKYALGDNKARAQTDFKFFHVESMGELILAVDDFAAASGSLLNLKGTSVLGGVTGTLAVESYAFYRGEIIESTVSGYYCVTVNGRYRIIKQVL
jgi:hypothetical protein